MAIWLFKTEPGTYSFDNLVADRKTWWTGVANAQARIHLRTVASGDRVWFYHTGSEKAIVGEARVTGGPMPEGDDPKSVMVEIEPVRKVPVPVTLSQIKADPAFAGWDLVRLPRLSVLPVPAGLSRRIEKLAGF